MDPLAYVSKQIASVNIQQRHTAKLNKQNASQRIRQPGTSSQDSNEGAQRARNNVPTPSPRPVSQNMVCNQVIIVRAV